MHIYRLPMLLTVIIVFSVVGLPAQPTRAQAAQAPNACQLSPTAPGFSVAGVSRGAVVTLCAKFVADKTKSSVVSPGPKSKTPGAPKVSPKPQPLDAETKARLRHRKLAKLGKTNFSPSQLVIKASVKLTHTKKRVDVSVAHPRQFRTTYLIGRYVSLRFTPIKIDLHFDAQTTVSLKGKRPFAASVRFLTTGWHVIRGVVTYKASYRRSGSRVWNPIAGVQQLAAISTKVNVTNTGGPVASNRTPYLVQKDCQQNLEIIGCLN
ncbi:MAG: hypothetical protein RL196_821 [Actinomycetota bacterium]|jgi:hypothetical protein